MSVRPKWRRQTRGRSLVAAGLALLPLAAPAGQGELTLHDTLDCGFANGSFVRMERAYHVATVPLPIMHGSRVRKESSWHTLYFQASDGRRWPLSRRVEGAGNDDVQQFARSCAYLGWKQGVVMAPWFSAWAADRSLTLPAGNWAGSMAPDPTRRDAALQAALAGQNLAGGVLGLVLWQRFDGELVSEQAIESLPQDGAPRTLAAVYQSRSSDGGNTWSAPVITRETQIFELGKPWAAQCFTAVPLRFNKRPLTWPARCK